jgi:hypothetical protein
LLYAFDDMGEQQVKNVARPIRVFALDTGAIGALAPTEARLSELHDAAYADATLAIPLPDKPSIAVLPFTNMSGDPEQDYFADGMVEEIITDLSRIRWLFVIARNSSFTYKGRTVDIKQIGASWAVATCSKAVCARRVTACASRDSWLMPRPVSTAGPTTSTALWTTFSTSRTGSLPALRVSSNPSCRTWKWNGRGVSLPRALTPMTSTYMRWRNSGVAMPVTTRR